MGKPGGIRIYHVDSFSECPLANTGDLWLPHKKLAIEVAHKLVRSDGYLWSSVTAYNIKPSLSRRKLILALLNRRGFFLDCDDILRIDHPRKRKA